MGFVLMVRLLPYLGLVSISFLLAVIVGTCAIVSKSKDRSDQIGKYAGFAFTVVLLAVSVLTLAHQYQEAIGHKGGP